MFSLPRSGILEYSRASVAFSLPETKEDIMNTTTRRTALAVPVTLPLLPVAG